MQPSAFEKKQREIEPSTCVRHLILDIMKLLPRQNPTFQTRILQYLSSILVNRISYLLLSGPLHYQVRNFEYIQHVLYHPFCLINLPPFYYIISVRRNAGKPLQCGQYVQGWCSPV